MTKYHPIYEVNKIIKGYAVKYSKGPCKVHSLWYFNDDFNDERTELVICTTLPGVWIGKMGKDIEQLKNELNEVIAKHNDVMQTAYVQGRLTFKPDIVPELKVSFIECNF